MCIDKSRDIIKHVESSLSWNQIKESSSLFKIFKDISSRLIRSCKNLIQVRKGLYSLSTVDLLNLINVYVHAHKHTFINQMFVHTAYDNLIHIAITIIKIVFGI